MYSFTSKGFKATGLFFFFLLAITFYMRLPQHAHTPQKKALLVLRSGTYLICLKKDCCKNTSQPINNALYSGL